MDLNADRFRRIAALSAAVLMVGYLALIATGEIGHVLADARPMDPWSAAIVADGWRVAHGLPVYESVATGHAALMYGPAQSYLLGALFLVLPASKLVPEVLSVVASGALIGLGIVIARPFQNGTWLWLLGLSLLACEDRLATFASGRPDMVAWCFGFLGLVFSYRARYCGGVSSAVASVALAMAAVLFKQPAAMLALVAPLMLLVDRPRERIAQTAILAIAPLAGIGALFALLYLISPTIVFYMVTVPRRFAISRSAVVDGIAAAAAGAACLWFAVGWRLSVGGKPAEELGRRRRWLATTLAICLPLAAVTAAKAGGGQNAYVPVWLGTVLLAFLLVSPADDRATGRLWGIALALFVAFLPPSIAPVSRSFRYASFAQADRNYRDVVAQVRGLSGRVASPDDPTILISAGRSPGRSIYADEDALGWPGQLPAFDRDDLVSANYVVHDAGCWQLWLEPPQLQALGFRLAWSDGQYSIWRRA